MNPDGTSEAWLEAEDGSALELARHTLLGREIPPGTGHRFAAPGVSARHAFIHEQDGVFWLADCASTNGTYVNERRIFRRHQLADGHIIGLGKRTRIIFRQPVAQAPNDSDFGPTEIEPPELETRWLLLLDLVEGTEVSKQLPPLEHSQMLDAWFSECLRHAEGNGAEFNKFSGDGFLATWRDVPESPAAIAVALHALTVRQAEPPGFRWVLHRGSIVIGGVRVPGEEGLTSMDVNFIFRFEGLAKTLARPSLITPAAAVPLAPHLALEEIPGPFEMKNFTIPAAFALV